MHITGTVPMFCEHLKQAAAQEHHNLLVHYDMTVLDVSTWPATPKLLQLLPLLLLTPITAGTHTGVTMIRCMIQPAHMASSPNTPPAPTTTAADVDTPVTARKPTAVPLAGYTLIRIIFKANTRLIHCSDSEAQQLTGLR